jgi:hypothetical protein
MKILLCFSNIKEASHFIESNTSNQIEIDQMGKKLNRNGLEIYYQYLKDGMTIDVLIIGNTVHESALRTNIILSEKKYHIALLMGIGMPLVETLIDGDLVNVINDKPAYFNTDNENYYASGMSIHTDFPHFRGGYINMTNAYFDVFVDVPKVVSVTSENELQIEVKTSELKASIQSSNGLGFVQSCLWYGHPFYQLRIIKSKSYNETEAMEKMYASLQQILKLIR